MDKIKWVLQANLINEQVADKIKEALKLDNIGFEEVKIIPFSSELPEIKSNANFTVFYGSTTLILNAYFDGRFSKGVFFDEQKFNIKNYNKVWGTKMLNYDQITSSLEKFSSAQHNQNSEWFLRPNDDYKSFSGTVMKFSEIQKFATNLIDSNNPYLSTQSIISFSTPKIITKEWRHFIVNKKIISSCRYLYNGQLDISDEDIPTDLLDFVMECCKEYTPHDIFVLDTALYKNDYFIIECNCFNGTGFYNHDIIKIIRAVNEYLKSPSSKI